MTKEQKYTVSLKGGAVSIDEMEVDAGTAAKIVRLIMPVGGNDIPMANEVVDRASTMEVDAVPNAAITSKQFMAQKQPKSDVERITCLAFYLTQYKGVSTFKTIDLTHLNVEAAQPRLSNASFTARNAVAQQYLAPAGGGKKQITPRGEALVKAMPDRSAVKDALEQHPLHGKKRKSNGKGAKKKAAK